MYGVLTTKVFLISDSVTDHIRDEIIDILIMLLHTPLTLLSEPSKKCKTCGFGM